MIIQYSTNGNNIPGKIIMSSNNPVIQHEVIVYNITFMYKYTFYYALYSVRVSISYYVLHIAMLVLLIDYSSRYKSYASEPFLYSETATQ